uniref:RING-type domain-containing protein n=1 Tax=Vannella robusta TaxID=1487602 RepID=A0A7S4HMD8_9EUKA|mmetsp:Transcript_1276/g.1634  ORF Transcript_1276/g.1634 Transcript_1276/m.1634 type:complete len:255 (+) Transcript_1276:1-765(+)
MEPNSAELDPLDTLCCHLYSLAESQRETNTLLSHLMQKPISQNFLSSLPNITYLRGSHSVLISSQNNQLKKLWCTDCKKKSLVNINPQQRTAQSQCGHLQYCRECSIETHKKIVQCPHCIPLLHSTADTASIKTVDTVDQCPVCSALLSNKEVNLRRGDAVFQKLLTDYYVVVDTNDPIQCMHIQNYPGTKRERDWDGSEDTQPKKLIRLDLHKNIIPTVKEMGKFAKEVGSNFLARLSELDEEEDDSYFDGLA